ncbi:MAG: very short patch repair endonuclease [Acidobacteriota bacterium]|nr:very short patch repair endonuclease [Acidobacteriota bacterium]
MGKPDLVFKSARALVFVDGDFWHGRALIEEGPEGLTRGVRTPRSDWWLAKIGRNVERDRRYTKQLHSEGWRVLRIWESEVKADVMAAANKVERFVNRAKKRAS